MKQCSNCGAPLENAAQVCNECGASQPNSIACPHCGKTMPAFQNFCNACGGQLYPDTVAPVTNPAVAAAPMVAAAPAAVIDDTIAVAPVAVNPAASVSETATVQSAQGGKSKGLMIGLIIALSVLTLVIVGVVVYLVAFNKPVTREVVYQQAVTEPVEAVAETTTAAAPDDFYTRVSSCRYLTWDDVADKSQWELCIMRNEIYARHGRYFKRNDLTEYFSQFDWYQPYTWDVDHALSEIEKYNIRYIKDFEY